MTPLRNAAAFFSFGVDNVFFQVYDCIKHGGGMAMGAFYVHAMNNKSVYGMDVPAAGLALLYSFLG